VSFWPPLFLSTPALEERKERNRTTPPRHLFLRSLLTQVLTHTRTHATTHNTNTPTHNNSYYAHLAAFRGRLMVQLGGGDTASEVSGSSGGGRPPAQMLTVPEDLTRRMFYV